VFTAQFQAGRLQNVEGMLLMHFTLKDADALTAACVEWAWAQAVVT